MIYLINYFISLFTQKRIIIQKTNQVYFSQFLRDYFSDRTITIIDVGANVGQSVKKFLILFKNPIIHCFEPNIIAFEELSKKYGENPNIILNNFALGERKQIKLFNNFATTSSSSFLKVNKKNPWLKIKANKYNINPKNFIKRRSKVFIETLDNYIEDKKIKTVDLLKIDVQGYEQQVLSGCKKLIKKNNISVIVTEIICGKMYEKYLNLSDIEKFLLPKFRLAGIRANKESLLEISFGVNLLYVNKKKLPKLFKNL
jgi:FkbM family methyltransferase